MAVNSFKSEFPTCKFIVNPNSGGRVTLTVKLTFTWPVL